MNQMEEEGQKPHARRKTDETQNVNTDFHIGVQNGLVTIRFNDPVNSILLPPEQALEIAVAIMKYARRAGLKEPVVWRVGENKPRKLLNPNDRERGDA